MMSFLKNHLRLTSLVLLGGLIAGACGHGTLSGGGSGDGDGDGDGDVATGGNSNGDGDGDTGGTGNPSSGGNAGASGDGDGDTGGMGGGTGGDTCDPTNLGGMGGLASACPEVCDDLACGDGAYCTVVEEVPACACKDGFEGETCARCEQTVISDDFADGDLGTFEETDTNGGFSHYFSCNAPASEPAGTDALLQTAATKDCTSGIVSESTLDANSVTRPITGRFSVSSTALIASTGLSLGFQQRDGFSIGGGDTRPYIFARLRAEESGVGLSIVAETAAGAVSTLLDDTTSLDPSAVEDGFVLVFEVAPNDTWSLRIEDATTSNDPVQFSGSLGIHTFQELFRTAASFSDQIRVSAYLSGDDTDDMIREAEIDRIELLTHQCSYD